MWTRSSHRNSSRRTAHLRQPSRRNPIQPTDHKGVRRGRKPTGGPPRVWQWQEVAPTLRGDGAKGQSDVTRAQEPVQPGRAGVTEVTWPLLEMLPVVMGGHEIPRLFLSSTF